MTIRLSIICVLLLCTCSFALQDSGTIHSELDTPKKRQAAVESGLITNTWANGHSFNIADRMRILDVPGVSIVVIHNGKIDWAAGYGVRDETSGLPVTTETLFQAASISKPVAALATMRLAQEKRLDLDAPIQSLLTSYKLPKADFEGEVTARNILNHTAGLNVDGFAGYKNGGPIPTAAELLTGKGNSESLRQIETPGTRYRYSGGGSTMLQIALTDLTGQDFNTLMQENVFNPLGMTRSTYEQPLAVDKWSNHSAAHDHGGRRISGGFHVYPEQFPAGLWTTPTDLAKFVLEIQQVAQSNSGQVLTPESGKQMLTPVFSRAALGLFITEFGGEKWFRHSGSNQGFKCDFRASFSGGNGVIVMTNGEMGFEVCQDLIRAVAKVYGWPDMIDKPLEEIPLSHNELSQYTGEYAFSPDEVAFITIGEGRLMVQQLPYPKMPLAPLGDHRFQIIGTEFHIDFNRNKSRNPDSLTMSYAPGQRAQQMTIHESWPVQDLLRGDTTKAIQSYQRIYQADPKNPIVNSDRLNRIAVSLLKFMNPEAAQELCVSLTEMHPTNARTWDVLGQVNSQLNETGAAIKAYKECLRRIPKDLSLDESSRSRLRDHTLARLRWLQE
ncbi:MAG: serine hydrolase [Phycisphaerales bacterium]